MRRLFSALGKDRSGNFGLISALIMLPLLGIVGLGVDIVRALNVKVELQAAADAAAIDAVSDFSVKKTFSSGEATIASLKEASEQAVKMFNGQIYGKKVLSDVAIAMTPTITQDTVRVKAVVNFHAGMPTTFLQALGLKTLNVAGEAHAESLAPVYTRLHLLFDNSPSMGVAATAQEIARMEKLTPDKCAFACHDRANSNNYLSLARKNNVLLRFDLVKEAALKIADTITKVRYSDNQYLLNLYTFGATAEEHVVSPITVVGKDISNMASFQQMATAINLMSLPNAGYNSDMQSYIPQALDAVNKLIPDPGNGLAASSPQQILMIVSDGVSDGKRTVGCTKQLYANTRCQEPLDPTYCETIKKRGVRIAVLYTTYLPLPSNSWYNYYIAPFQSEIPKKMEACATPGLFFEVSFNGGIAEAMQALFLKAINMPRLSH